MAWSECGNRAAAGARRPRRRPAVTRLGRAWTPIPSFSGTLMGGSTCWRGRWQHASTATFIFCSTNKVYGDLPNHLPLEEHAARLELPSDHHYYAGVDTSMSIDRSMHSLFGASKVAADVLVQEYGRYFDMPTVCFRGGCLTGPQHARRPAPRIPRLPDAVHRRRSAVHDLRVRRQAGARQHPLRRCRARLRAVPPSATSGRRVQPRRRSLEQRVDARSHHALRTHQWERAAIRAERAGAHGRSPLVRERPPRVPA